MNSFLLRWYNQIRDFYAGLSSGKRALLWVALVVLVTATLLIGHFATQNTYSVLYSGLDVEDSSMIIQKLREKKIPFKVEGDSISVLPDFVYDTRLMLASEGLPGTSNVVGLEIFDQANFGVSSYVQRINYVRAKEGELTRTINRLVGVERSRVHVTIPEKKTFVEEEQPAKASVILKLKNGTNLSQAQIRGIQHLVASAVEGLDKENVAVVDQSGKVLSNISDNSEIGISNKNLEYKRRVEKIYEEQIVSLLERVMGPGKVVARVSADIDFSKETITVEDFDPDKIAVRSKVVSEKSAKGSRPSPTGVPGARANMPESQGGENIPTVRQDSVGTTETVNNEITKTIKNINKNVGNVQRLTIAVLVDGKYENVTNPDGEATGKKFVPLTEEMVKKYTEMVKNTVGVVDNRDHVTVECMQFQDIDLGEADKALSIMERWKLIRIVVQYAVIGLLIVLFFFFFVRPFIRWITETMSESPDELLPTTLVELENMHNADVPGLENLGGSLPMLEEAVDPDKAEGELLKERIMALIETDPLKATQAMQEWIYDSNVKDKDKEKEEEVA